MRQSVAVSLASCREYTRRSPPRNPYSRMMAALLPAAAASCGMEMVRTERLSQPRNEGGSSAAAVSAATIPKKNPKKTLRIRNPLVLFIILLPYRFDYGGLPPVAEFRSLPAAGPQSLCECYTNQAGR